MWAMGVGDAVPITGHYRLELQAGRFLVLFCVGKSGTAEALRFEGHSGRFHLSHCHTTQNSDRKSIGNYGRNDGPSPGNQISCGLLIAGLVSLRMNWTCILALEFKFFIREAPEIVYIPRTGPIGRYYCGDLSVRRRLVLLLQ